MDAVEKAMVAFGLCLALLLGLTVFFAINQELKLRSGTYTIVVSGNEYSGCKRTMFGWVNEDGVMIDPGHETVVVKKEK